MSTVTCCDCPLRERQICAAARPAAAILACAAAATRNDDGSIGSSPVRVTFSSAAGSLPAAVQMSLRISLGLGMIPRCYPKSFVEPRFSGRTVPAALENAISSKALPQHGRSCNGCHRSIDRRGRHAGDRRDGCGLCHVYLGGGRAPAGAGSHLEQRVVSALVLRGDQLYRKLGLRPVCSNRLVAWRL